MKYEGVREGVFLFRPNRFVARVLLDGREIICHVKNTGRCRELLIPGSRVFLCPGAAPGRKTGYDLIAVYKGDRLINIDSQAPNRVFHEWARAGGFLPGITAIRPETAYGQSRLDFLLETRDKPWLVEVKGVTLEEGGMARFPDAPTLRGSRHLKELAQAASQGYGCCAFFVIQMDGMTGFCPNDETDPAFGLALREAEKRGVRIEARCCGVTPDTMEMGEPVPVFL